MRFCLLFAITALGACSRDEETDTTGETDTEDTVDTDTNDGMPTDPAPFTVQMSGEYDRTLVFDAPTCTLMGANFRMFWRNSEGAHAFVLIAETLGQFTGPGDFDQTLPNTRAKLQEEQYGEGIGPFQTDAAQGDTFSMHVEHLDPESYTEAQRAWGSFDVGGMHSTTGAITVSPTNLPIWCPAVNG